MQISRLSLIFVLVFSNYEDSHLVWYGLLFGKNYWEYCNKQALICNRLRAVSKIGVDTGYLKEI